MLGTSDWEFVCGVEVDDLWDGVKGWAVLPQHIFAVFTLSELHVHEALTAPVNKEEEEGNREKREHEIWGTKTIMRHAEHFVT